MDVYSERFKKYALKEEFEAEPIEGMEKFFVNFPYPYINGYLHIGHLFTALKADISARYQRLKGKNVLFAQGFHATGQPIVAAAERIREGEPKQIEILRKMGINDIEKFKDPKRWVEFFSKAAKEDLKAIGFSADWRRSFITTELNLPYDKFIQWQYKLLYKKGYLYKGKHAVVYCPKCKHALGDHDRAEGEGVMPEEVSLIKFKMGDAYLLAMTFRPETTWGVTNLWINKDAEYVICRKGKEKWIIAKHALHELENQGYDCQVEKEIKGEELLNKEVENLVTGKKVKIYHAPFVDVKKGTGIVMSVPAHAPYDYAALLDLGKEAEKLELISLIELPGYGVFPAKEAVEKAGVKSSKEKEKLDALTKEIYKKEFHEGKLKPIFGEFSGLKVSEAKEKIINYLNERGVRLKFYVLPEPVVCRCLTPAVVKVVEDQWFIKYSDEKWKRAVKDHVKDMNFYPENLREVFLDAVDWLHDWAFTRDRGLGTRFPIEPDKVIESLSDSTIYMAYYTIAHYLQNPEQYGIDWNKLNDEFFDYVFLGKGSEKKVSKTTGISTELLRKMREEFEYWYEKGFELRVSGKDLIKNHLTMMLFHHYAVFGKEKMPKGIAVNGYVMVEGEKMSKSKGNFYTIREAIEKFGLEELRALAAYAGDVGLDDANYELKLAPSITKKMQWFEDSLSDLLKTSQKYKKLRQADAWLLRAMMEVIYKVDTAYSRLKTKTAFQHAFFEMYNLLKRYLKRVVGKANYDIIENFANNFITMLYPIMPHYSLYLAEKLFNKSELENFPAYDVLDKSEVEEFEEYLDRLVEDIKEVIKILGKKPSKIVIGIAEPWKYKFYKDVKKAMEKTKNLKEIIAYIKNKEYFKGREKEIIKVINRIAKLPDYKYLTRQSEISKLYEDLEYLQNELNAEIEILEKDKDLLKKALPYKPAIYVM
ncbi:MAG: leucine--tRNA ligase [Candidatus Nanohaloarchaeota archaeon]|nr:leucine--tRNA ligase [Candidatus Nanohaloarchaeota archaeon]